MRRLCCLNNRVKDLISLGRHPFGALATSLQRSSVVRMSSRGAFIVFEGADRAGKSTQCQMLLDYLKETGVTAELWRFPDRTTAIGSMINSYLQSKSDIDDAAVHLLFSANRWEKKAELEHKLSSGTTLIVDRYAYSGVAFTAAKDVPGLDRDWCKAPDSGLPAPDAVLFLSLSPATAESRGGFGEERYEKIEFQKAVLEQFTALKDSSWETVNADGSREDVAATVRSIATDVIEKCRQGAPLQRLW